MPKIDCQKTVKFQSYTFIRRNLLQKLNLEICFLNVILEPQPKFDKQFPKLELVKIDQLGGWNAVQSKHFNDNGIFDQIYGPK